MHHFSIVFLKKVAFCSISTYCTNSWQFFVQCIQNVAFDTIGSIVAYVTHQEMMIFYVCGNRQEDKVFEKKQRFNAIRLVGEVRRRSFQKHFVKLWDRAKNATRKWIKRRWKKQGENPAFWEENPSIRVIRVGLEPTTPTLKVLCSTSWASESALTEMSENRSYLISGCKGTAFFWIDQIFRQ